MEIKRKNRILVYILIVVFAVLLARYIFKRFYGVNNLSSIEKCLVLELSDNESYTPFYIKIKVWGISGNHEMVYLSLFNRDEPVIHEDYIFHSLDVFYSVTNENEVTIYAPESSYVEPKEKLPNVKVVLLSNFDEIKDLKMNHKQLDINSAFESAFEQ